jgi:diguanylate cyclase (GGDEF)-like protein
VSTAPYVPAPVAEADVRARSEALRHCLEQVLAEVLDASEILALDVGCPVLLDGPVSAERRRPSVRLTQELTEGPSLTVTSERIPASQYVPESTLWVSVAGKQSHPDARALAVLLSAVMAGEMRQQLAESTARGALEIANRDPATGLGNRRAWLHTLRVEEVRAQRNGRPLTVLVLDIDGLKAVNDAHGHAAGDDLIVRTAAALSSARRATDEVCRLGGDEFGMTAPDTDAMQAQLLAARVQRCLQLSGVRVSLGWAVSAGEGTVEDLWQQADAAMYADKRSRR